MRFSPLAFALLVAVGLSACSAPAPTTAPTGSRSSTYVAPPDGGPNYGPGDTCAETYVIVSDNPRSNFSLGSENYRNEDFCGAYPYLKWLVANEPLFNGEEPDDRNFLRLAGVYEYFATQVDSTDDAGRLAYIDSSLATRRAGRQAMEAAGIQYDGYSRDLREGFTYFQNAGLYENADEQQFESFNRAFEAQPDSLEDWYIQQLFNGSSLEYGEDLAARATYLDNLSGYVDDPALKTYFTEYVTFLRTEPAEPGEAVAANDTAVQELIASANAGTICGNGETTLLATLIQQPDRVTDLGADPAALQSIVIRCPQIQSQVDNPRTLLALAFQEYGDGNSARGNELFQRAIANAGSNSQRADFYYARYRRTNNSGDLTEALRANPTHGPSLYTRAGFSASAVGRRSDVRGRAAYWCLADIYRNVAATTTDSGIAATARRAAAQYERSGPTREQYFLSEGWRPGQTITASLGSAGSCSTRVR